MSNPALNWAFAANLKRSCDKFVLVTLANYADDDGICYPSQAKLVADTSLDRKTIISALDRLSDAGLIEDTGLRKGATSQIIVYRLIGVDGPVCHYTYRVYDPQTGEFYIGKRSFDGDPTADTYRGSGKWVAEARAAGRVLLREIIEQFDTAAEALAHEQALFRQHGPDPLCRNQGTPHYMRSRYYAGNGTVGKNGTVPDFPVKDTVFPDEGSRISVKQSQKRDTEPSEPPIEPSRNPQSSGLLVLAFPSDRVSRRLLEGEPDGFEEFWADYPRKVGKGQARRAWAAAVKRVTPDRIIAAVRAARWNANPKYIPHPATWLNGERWADEADNRDPVLVAAMNAARGLMVGGSEWK